ncbi:Alpha-acetolactate decarboxylase [Staphylococcus arlettae]|nr:Alpha-acetolactate decarboxylase [Staphylococcus arlettae]
MDDKVYHANEHKDFIELKNDELTPYTTVTKFKADATYQTKDKSFEDVFDELKENIFSAVKISGVFKKCMFA